MLTCLNRWFKNYNPYDIRPAWISEIAKTFFFFFIDFKNSWTNRITFAEGFLQDMKHVNQEGSWHVYWWILFPAYHKIKTSWSKFGRTQQLCKALKPLVINISTQNLKKKKRMLLRILKWGWQTWQLFSAMYTALFDHFMRLGT